MSRARTSIRRMYAYGAAVVSRFSCLTVSRMSRYVPREERKVLLSRKGNAHFYRARPVLVIPDNPAARAAMIDRVVKTDPSVSRATVEYVLATALTP